MRRLSTFEFSSQPLRQGTPPPAAPAECRGVVAIPSGNGGACSFVRWACASTFLLMLSWASAAGPLNLTNPKTSALDSVKFRADGFLAFLRFRRLGFPTRACWRALNRARSASARLNPIKRRVLTMFFVRHEHGASSAKSRTVRCKPTLFMKLTRRQHHQPFEGRKKVLQPTVVA